MKILIAEDDLVCQKVLLRFLEDLGEIQVADDGAQAWELYTKAYEGNKPFELICLDIMMPHSSGKEVLAKIRAHELSVDAAQRAKILMTTALSDTETIVASFQSGCEAYITKPIERAHLLEELGRLGIVMPVKH
jgi:two-component system chemotaxis response regulator CheY